MSSPAAQDRLAYPVREVAYLLGVSERSVWRWIKAGSVRTIRLGRSRRIPAVEVSRLVRGPEALPAPQTSSRALRIAAEIAAKMGGR